MSKKIIEGYLNQNHKDIAGLFNWMMMPGLDLSTIQVSDLSAKNSNIYQTTRALVEKIKNSLSTSSSQGNLSTEFFYWIRKSGVDSTKLTISLIPTALQKAFQTSLDWAARVNDSEKLPFTKQSNIDLITWMLRCNNLAGAFNWMMRPDVNIKKDNIPAIDQLQSSDFRLEYQEIFRATRDLAKKLKEGTLVEKDREKCMQWLKKVKLEDLESFSSLSQGEKTPAEALFSAIKVQADSAAKEAEKNKESLIIRRPKPTATISTPLSILQQLKNDTITLDIIEENLPMLQSILFDPECLLYLIQNGQKEFLSKAMRYYLAQRRMNEKSLTSNDFENLANALKGKTDLIKDNRKVLLNALIQLDESRKFVAPLCVELKKTFKLTDQIAFIASNLSPTWLLALCETPDSSNLLSSIFEKFTETANATIAFKELIEKLICDFAKSLDDIETVVNALSSVSLFSKEKNPDFSKSLELASNYVKAAQNPMGARRFVVAILNETNNSDLWNVSLSLLSPEIRLSILCDKLAKEDITKQTRITAEKALILVLKTLSEKNAYTPAVLEILSKENNFNQLKSIYLKGNNEDVKADFVNILKNRSLFFGLYKAFNGTPSQKNNWDFVVDTCLNLNADVASNPANEKKQQEIISSLKLTKNDQFYIKNSIADNDFEIEHAKKYPNYVTDLKKQGFFSKLFRFKVSGQAERIKYYPKGSADILTPRITPEMAHYPLTTDTAGWSRLVAGTGSFGFHGMDPDVYKLVNPDSDFFERLQEKNKKKLDPRDGEILKNRRVLFNLYKELYKTSSPENDLKWVAVLAYLGLHKTNFRDVEREKKLALKLTESDFHYLKSDIKNNAFEIQYAKDYPGSWKKPEERTWGEYLSWTWSGQSTRNKHYKNNKDLATITPELSRYYADISKQGWDSFAETVPKITPDAGEFEQDDSSSDVGINRDSSVSTVSFQSGASSRGKSINQTDYETDDETDDDSKSVVSVAPKQDYLGLPIIEPILPVSSVTSRRKSNANSVSSVKSKTSSSPFDIVFEKEINNILDFISGDHAAPTPIVLNEDVTASQVLSTYLISISDLLQENPERTKETTLFYLMRFAFSGQLEDKQVLNSIKGLLEKHNLIQLLKVYLENSENREKLIVRYEEYRQEKEPGVSFKTTMKSAIEQRDAHLEKLSSNAIMTHDLGVKKVLPVSASADDTKNNVQEKLSSTSNTNSNSALNTRKATEIINEYMNLYKDMEQRHQSGLALYTFIQTLDPQQKIMLFKDLFSQEELDKKKPKTECFLCNLNATDFLSAIGSVKSKQNTVEEKLFSYLKKISDKSRIPFDTYYLKDTDGAKVLSILINSYKADQENSWISKPKKTGAELVAVYKTLNAEREKKSAWLSSSITTLPSKKDLFLEKLDAKKNVDGKNTYMKIFCIAMINEDDATQQQFFTQQLTPKMIDAIGSVLANGAFFTVSGTNDISTSISLLQSIQKLASPENALSIRNAAEKALADQGAKLKIFQDICAQVPSPLPVGRLTI